MDDGSAPRIRRLCIAAAAECQDQTVLAQQVSDGRGVHPVLVDGARLAGLHGCVWHPDETGAGPLAVLPPGVDEGRVISDLLRGLGVALYRHNLALDESSRLRMRLALHAGLTQVSEQGFTGPAPRLAILLRDCDQARFGPVGAREVAMVLLLSRQLHEDHLERQYPHFDVTAFRRIRVDHPGRGFAAVAWLNRPDASVFPLSVAHSPRQSIG